MVDKSQCLIAHICVFAVFSVVIYNDTMSLFFFRGVTVPYLCFSDVTPVPTPIDSRSSSLVFNQMQW